MNLRKMHTVGWAILAIDQNMTRGQMLEARFGLMHLLAIVAPWDCSVDEQFAIRYLSHDLGIDSEEGWNAAQAEYFWLRHIRQIASMN